MRGDLRQQRRAWRYHFARQQVGVDDRHAEGGEQVGDRGLAAGNAAGESDAKAARAWISVVRDTDARYRSTTALPEDQCKPAGDGEKRTEGDLRVFALALADHDARRRTMAPTRTRRG